MAKAWAEEFNGKMRPINKAQRETARKNAAAYIFVKDKEGNAVCQKCEREIVLKGTKHLQKCKCPKCRAELQVQHTWRMKQYLENIKWLAIPQVLNANTLVIRYVSGVSVREEMIDVNEDGRMYISENHAEPEYYCRFGDTWSKGKNPYFVPWYMSYRENHWFCMYADLYNPKQSMKELAKMDCFKYYDINTHYDKTRIVSQLHYLVKYARLNEKLEKVGMTGIIDSNFNSYLRNGTCIKFSRKKTNLVEMLRLTKAKYKYFKQSPSMETLTELQNIKDFNENEYAQMTKLFPGCYSRKGVYEIAADHNLNVVKIAKYLSKNNIKTRDYETYLNRIRRLGWTMTDDYYVFPKDFYGFNDKAYTEENKKSIEERRVKLLEQATAEGKKTEIIATIKNIICTAPELQDMFSDAEHGLKIYVPESVADLYMSGLVMHNCLSTFAERIVKKETLVFFIRRVEEPDKDYVAFEYYNGAVKQIYESQNREVRDNNVVQFADRFVERLNEINIMERIG